MIPILIALGVLGVSPAAVGDITATADQTAKVSSVPTVAVSGVEIPLGAVIWAQPLDPSDRAKRAIDFSSALPAGSKIFSIERLTVSAVGAALGFQIVQEDPRRPIIGTDGLKVQLWFCVDPAFQSNPAFSGNGTPVAVSVLVRTDADPYEEYERTNVQTVRQL